MKKYIIDITIFVALLLIMPILIADTQKKPVVKTIVEKPVEYKYIEKEKPTYKYLKSVTVRIKGEIPIKINNDKSIRVPQKWGGTGVIIKIDKDKQETYILTNAHVTTKNKEAILMVEDVDRLIYAQVVKYHKYLDLAVIKIGVLLDNKNVIKGYSNIKPQKEVYLVGHHLGKAYLYGEGVFAGYRGMYGIIQLPVLFGDSGSGVFNIDGKLVGIVFAGEIYNSKGAIDVAHGMIIETYNIKIFLRKLGLLDE